MLYLRNAIVSNKLEGGELTKRMGDVGYHLICHLFEAAPPSLACQSFTITGALTFSKKEPFAPELFNLILILYTDHI